MGGAERPADGAARDDETAEIFEEPRNCGLPVARRSARWKAKSWSTALSPFSIAAFDRGLALGDFADMRRRRARSAARPAARPRRRAQFHHVEHFPHRGMPSKASRNGRRDVDRDERADALPRHHQPLGSQAATASRTTVRLTPIAATISCSVGSCAPGGSLPLMISAVSRSTDSPGRPRCGSSGRNSARFFCERLFVALSPMLAVGHHMT